MTATAEELVREALHLRQYGEYAPGGTENWRDWDRKATEWAYAQPIQGGSGAVHSGQ